LFIGPLPTFPENFMQIRSEVFCAKLRTDRQTNSDGNITSSSAMWIKTNSAFVRLQQAVQQNPQQTESM